MRSQIALPHTRKLMKTTSSRPLSSHPSWAPSPFCLHTTSTPTACAGCPCTSPCKSVSPCRCLWAWASPPCLLSQLTTGSCLPTRPSHHLECHRFSVCPASSRRTERTRFVCKSCVLDLLCHKLFLTALKDHIYILYTWKKPINNWTYFTPGFLHFLQYINLI